ncbi:hypothetical protein VHEMI09457 [[Torrubiella] hemipterigena]|uniref:Phosphatidate phosphatase APP1 catalytic domain-containing protein n=1 Tax=[Torrubiella] hemipterigena TaxID=1531966 RepID=A0A0A1T9Y0_9HYPO|nr:hypothetical protein VHEMI09457 [[Torrubiella] hemipterigena]
MAKDEPAPNVPNAAKLALDMQMRTRKEHNFSKVEEDLLDPRPIQTNTLTVSSLRSKLGFFNPFAKKTVSRGDLVWLFDNTAFRHSRMSSWQAEFVTAVFEKESANRLVDLAASIARIVGLADDAKERETIEQRLQPFAWDIRVGRNAVISQEGSRKTIKLGATGSEGCSSDVINISSHGKGSFVRASAVVTGGIEGILDMQTYYAGEDGWAIISDIDDTIKVTMTSDPIGILKETFINEPRPIDGMPELYTQIKAMLPKDTPWFYLSASPYTLYPFLKEFRNKFYPPGTMILRDSSWRTISGLLASLTMVTEEYKVDRMKKVNSWLPKKKLIVFGDSTQSDPEAYGEMYVSAYNIYILSARLLTCLQLPHFPRLD